MRNLSGPPGGPLLSAQQQLQLLQGDAGLEGHTETVADYLGQVVHLAVDVLGGDEQVPAFVQVGQVVGAGLL